MADPTLAELRRASTLKAEVADEDVLKALPYANNAQVREFQKSLRTIDDPEIRANVREQGQKSIATLKGVRKAAKAQMALAAQRGDRETLHELRAGLRGSLSGKVEPEQSTAGKVATGIFKAIDFPHQVVRNATYETLADKPRPDRSVDAKEWSGAIREKAEQPGVSIADVVRAPAQAIGKPLGGLIGANAAAVGALTDIPGLIRGDRSGGDIWKNAKETVSNTIDDTEDLALQMYTDPLSYLSLGVGGAAENSGKAALRGAVGAGLGRAEAEVLGKQAAKLVQVAGGTERTAPAAVKLFEKTFERSGLGAARGAQAARKTFGQGMEFLGRGQLEAHLPGLSQYPIRPLAAVTGKDFAGGKALKAVADPALTKLGARPLFDPTRQVLKSSAREAVAAKEILKRENLDRLRSSLEKLPASNQFKDPKVREAILDTYFDPQMGPQLPGHLLDQQFGPGAEQFALGVENWFRRNANDLIKTGVLEPGQIAANPVSGQYVPRAYKSVFNPLEEVVDSTLRGRYSSGSTITKARKLDLPTDQLPYAKREKDLFKLAPGYAEQSARLQAQKLLEDRLVKAYGTAPGRGAGSNLKRTTLHLSGRDVELPADVANVLRGTFDQGLGTMGKALRNAGLDSTPVGRAVLSVVDFYGRASSRFKGLVLKTPAYHAINVVDDVTKMALDGNHNPLAFLTKARKLLRGESVDVGGRGFTLADANKHKIGLDAAARFERDTAENATRALEGAVDKTPTLGSKVKSAASVVNGVSDRFGQEWENTAKAAHWLYRLSKGDSPAIAARRAFEVLIDYGTKSKAEQVAGWVVPFLKYAVEAPQVTARLAVRNPGAMNLLDRGIAQYGDEGHEPRRYITERGRFQTLGEQGQRVAGNMRETFGGSPKRGGLDLGVVPRLTPFEAFKPIEELLSGNLDPVVMQLGPASKAIAELALERDMLTKEDLSRPDSFFDMFPNNAPVPKALRASEGENPWLSRYLPQFLVSPGTMLGANYAINQATGPAGPIATLGGQRPYTGREQPADIYAMNVAKYLFGQPLYETTPADALWNRAHEPVVQKAVKGSQAARRTLKLERREDRRR